VVTIIQDFIPSGRRNRPGCKMEARYITIHDTANTRAGADARAHARYLKTYPDLIASWHFTVDDKEIYQHLPLKENGWHAGDGRSGTGNRQSIGIEICENRDGNRPEAEANAAWLTAKLLQEFSLGIEQIKQHNHWSGKDCPRVLRSRVNGWSGFLSAVEKNLVADAPPPDESPPEDGKTGWLITVIRWILNKLKRLFGL
jgi:N-acetylmuramoyl-L-alanine amidase